MEDLFHYTRIHLFEPHSEWYWDEQLQDKVWKKVFFYYITKDISMRWEWDPFVMVAKTVELPTPDPKTFIPFDHVDERIVLGWIDDLISDEILEMQKKNTMMLEIKESGGHHDDDISAREERDYLKRK